MVRRSVSTLLLAFLLLWSLRPGVSAQANVEEAIRKVIVVNPTEQRFLRRGIAFHVGGGVFYTNAHVVKSPVPEGFTAWYLASNTSTRSISSWLGPVTVSCVHPRWRPTADRTNPTRATPFDVAVIRMTEAPDLPVLPFADAAPALGQRVTVKGFPRASRAWPSVLYTATGRIFQIIGQDQIFRIQLDAGLYLGGSSGSPVLAEDSRVVGIAYSGSGVEGRTATDLAGAIFAGAALEGCPR
jgi:V8-like Glu-specific endopeptidase